MTIHAISSHSATNHLLHGPICIVGAGIAGLLVARRLAKSGLKVIVIESGGDNAVDDVNRLNEIDDPGRHYTRSTTGRHRGLGGTSSRWGGRLIPISGHDTAARSHISQGGWPFPMNELDGYEEDIEALFKVAPGSYEDLPENQVESRHFPKGAPSLTPRWAKCPSFRHCNIATLLDDELRKSKAVDIWLGATVCDFEVEREGGRLLGIVARSFTGQEVRVRADRFIFAAGTIETTRLLLLLDAASGQRAFERCMVLGRYFQDHLKAEVATIGRRDPVATNRLFGYRYVGGTRRDLHLELSQPAQKRDRVASAFMYVAMDLAESPLSDIRKLAQGLQRRELDIKAVGRASPYLGLLARSAWWRYIGNQLFVPAGVELRLMACVEQQPVWTNRIRLSQSRDQLGCPMALFEWEPSTDDELAFRSVIAATAAYWSSAGFDRLCPLAWTAAAKDVSLPVIAAAEACAHPSGSTRMGTNPRESVVGPDLRCHAVPNVAVVSASVFPTAGSANPTFTIMKLALWLADSLLREAAKPAQLPVTAAGVETMSMGRA